MTRSTIPFARPCVGPKEQAAVAQVLQSRWLGMGRVTQQFEQRLAEYVGAKHVIATSRGTAALHLALDALDLGPGDEVVVPSLTFAATAAAIRLAGANPIFCEVCPETLNMEVEDVRRRLTERTKAILPVHFAGLACDMCALRALARKHGLPVIEDAAHAFGSRHDGQMIGSQGGLTCFSFSSTKNITCGEGGAVVTDDHRLAQIITQRRSLGIDQDTWQRENRVRKWQYRVVTHGFRYHMSDINAAIGMTQLAQAEAFAQKRRRIARRYDEAFRELKQIKLLRRNLTETVPHLYIIRVDESQRDAFVEYLANRGISTGVHYLPLHWQKAFGDQRVKLPTTEMLYRQILTLPMYVEMTETELLRVVEAVVSFAQEEVMIG